MTAAAARVAAWLACWLASRLSFVASTWEKICGWRAWGSNPEPTD